MINTQFNFTPAVIGRTQEQRREEPSGSLPTESFQPQLGFEPWIGPGKPGHPPVSPEPGGPLPEPAICPQPMIGFEPWLTGELTDNPSIGAQYADKLTRAFGEQALLSIKDDRISQVAGYYFDGLEGVDPGKDWLAGVTVPRLGDKWEMQEGGVYELRSGSLGQRLSFDMVNRQTVLESFYEENHFETSRYSEILRLDQDGTMRREVPPVGL